MISRVFSLWSVGVRRIETNYHWIAVYDGFLASFQMWDGRGDSNASRVWRFVDSFPAVYDYDLRLLINKDVAGTTLRYRDISLWTLYPGHFPLPASPAPFLHGVGLFPSHYHHPLMYNIKRSTVDVYEIDSGTSVRVKNTG